MLTGDPVYLTPDQQNAALEAITEEFAHIDVLPAILAIGGVHCHFLASFGSARIRRYNWPSQGRGDKAAS